MLGQQFCINLVATHLTGHSTLRHTPGSIRYLITSPVVECHRKRKLVTMRSQPLRLSNSLLYQRWEFRQIANG